MKVLGIAASPRRGGNSEILLDKTLDGASSCGAKTEKIALNDLLVKPCQACERCAKNGICFISDDMRRLYKKITEADAIVVASPVYFGSLTAQLKIIIDRCHSIWVRNFILSRRRHKPKQAKKGIFICVSNFNRRRFFLNSKDIVSIFFMVSGFKLFKSIYEPNLNYKGEVIKQRHLLKKAFRYGKELVTK